MSITAEEENKILKEKISQLIADNLELSSRLEYDYDINKQPVRKLTMQEKLEINMGNWVQKYRIPARSIKNIYASILKEINEPEFVDLSFDNDRMFTAYYFVDLEKEKQEIEKGESVEINVENISDDVLPPHIQQQLDINSVLDKVLK